MSKAEFQEGEKVYIEPLGIVGEVRKIVPLWEMGKGEPVEVYYDTGHGNLFDAKDLRAL